MGTPLVGRQGHHAIKTRLVHGVPGLGVISGEGLQRLPVRIGGVSRLQTDQGWYGES